MRRISYRQEQKLQDSGESRMRVLLAILVAATCIGVTAAQTPARAWYDRAGRWHPNGYRHYPPPARYYGYRPPPYYYRRPVYPPPPVYVVPPPYYRPPPPVFYPPY
jgi:hypothetical protein